jgi:hypothetical protein
MLVAPKRQSRAIAAGVSGEIPSAFDAPVPPAKPMKDDPLATRIASTKAGRLVVFADTDFIRDTMQQILPENFGPDIAIFLNTIDWATEDASLATMRARAALLPLEASEHARPIAWGINLFGMPLLVGLAGIARFLVRRRAGRRAAQQSRQGAAA